MDLYSILVTLMVFVGAIVSSLIGWYDAGGSFQARKFIPSFLRGIAGAVAAAIVYQQVPALTGIVGLLTAFLAGMGFDAAGNRLAGGLMSATGNKSPTVSK